MKSKLNSFQQSDLLYGTLLDVGYVGVSGKKYSDTPTKGWLLVTEAGVEGQVISGNFLESGKGPGFGGLITPEFDAEMVIRIKHGELSPFAILLKYYPALVNLRTRSPSVPCPIVDPATGESCSMAKGHAGPHRGHGNHYATWVTRCNGTCEYHSNQSGDDPPLRWQECTKCGHLLPYQLGRYVFETPNGTVWLYAPSNTDAVRNAKAFLLFTHVSASACQLKLNDRVIPLDESSLEASQK